jgi:hypothetical protein
MNAGAGVPGPPPAQRLTRAATGLVLVAAGTLLTLPALVLWQGLSRAGVYQALVAALTLIGAFLYDLQLPRSTPGSPSMLQSALRGIACPLFAIPVVAAMTGNARLACWFAPMVSIFAVMEEYGLRRILALTVASTVASLLPHLVGLVAGRRLTAGATFGGAFAIGFALVGLGFIPRFIDAFREAEGGPARPGLSFRMTSRRALLTVLAFGAFLYATRNPGAGLIEAGGMLLGAFAAAAVGETLVESTARRIALSVAPRAAVIAHVWDFVSRRSLTIGAFFGWYLALSFWFAAMHDVVWSLDPRAYRGLSAEPGLGEFWYFSIVTLATVGYGDIVPASSWARFLTVLEVFTGVAWVTVVIAALLSMSEQPGER